MTADETSQWSRLQRDLRRNHGTSRLVLAVYRLGAWCEADPRRRPLALVQRVLDLVFVKLLAGVDLPPQCSVGGGVLLKHGGKGIVIHRDVVMGEDVVIYHRVTIGRMEPRPERSRVPTIGDRVFIGVGASILGDVRVGDDAVIGAHAVVLRDVPPGASAVGVPAKILTGEERGALGSPREGRRDER